MLSLKKITRKGLLNHNEAQTVHLDVYINATDTNNKWTLIMYRWHYS